MPLYEYRCEGCGQVFEVLQKFSDEPLSTHAGCGGAVTRLISAAALQFKGTGWYVTDYARKNGSSADNGKAKASPKAAETKTETPAASKPESGSRKK
jgi:putative FmdB family regulatory protein